MFGLAGTLISLGKLPANGIDRGAYMAAIGMAVHATLYGLVFANLVLAPLARLVERREMREEAARQTLVDWLTRELTAILARHHEPHGAGSHGAGHHRSGYAHSGSAPVLVEVLPIEPPLRDIA